MADPDFIVGDLATVTNTFKVSNVNTDPTTISLAVTTPAGVTTTYTYAASQITRTAAGVYTKDITLSEAGTWAYVWTGTGAAADVADGTISVRATRAGAADATDLLTPEEAQDAVKNPLRAANASQLLSLLAAVSNTVDDLCGAVVSRAITSREFAGGGYRIVLPLAPVSETAATTVQSVTEYRQGTAVALTAESLTVASATSYLLERTEGAIYRRSSWAPRRFECQRVVVSYTPGRYASTALVGAHFKEAAKIMLAHVWRLEQGFAAIEPDVPVAGASFAVPKRALELLRAEMLPPVFA